MKRNDQQIYWDHAHTWWDRSQRFRLLADLVPARLAYFDRIVPDWQGVNVLDVGCGGGFMAEALARRGARVIGVDPCTALLDVARRHAGAGNFEIAYLAGTGEALPLEDHSVDRVVCVDVLEHVPRVEDVLAEIRRVLRPKGLFFFDTVNRNWLTRVLAVTVAEDLLRLAHRGIHDPAKFIRPAEMQFHLEQQGFTLDSKKFVGLGPVGLTKHLRFIIGLTPFTGLMYLGHAVANGQSLVSKRG